jgi:iron complex outermembrane receptor protein
MRSLAAHSPQACLVALLSLLLLPWTGQAQEPADQDLTSLTIEELAHAKLVSASRHLEDARKAPSAVSIVTSDEINRYGWRTIAEVLRSVRGFYSAYDRNYSYIGVRGFLQSGDYNARILLLINGHRINENVYDSALIGTEFPLDLDLIDRIEIVRGPSSSLYGTNAELGVVNIITRQPSEPLSIEVSADTTSLLGRSGRLTASLRKGAYSGIVSGSFYRNPGASQVYFPEFSTAENNYGIAQNLDGDSYTHSFADLQHGRLRVQGLYSSRLKVIPTGSYQTNFNDPANRTLDNRGYVDVSYHWPVNRTTEVDLRGYYDAYRFWGSYAYGGTHSPERSVQINDATADWVGAEAILARKLRRHRLVVGSSVEYNLRIDQKNYYLGDPPILNSHETPVLVAGFGEVELNLLPQLAVNLGGRLDWYDTFGAAASPRIAVMYLPNSRTSLKYIFGHAFRAPDAYDQYYVDQIDINTASRNLKPEDIHSHTVTFEQRLKPWLGLTVDGFLNRLDKIIEQEQDSASGITHFVNSPGDRGTGFEFELNAKRSSGWAGRASYTFVSTQEHGTGGSVNNSPTHLAKLNATIPFSKPAFLGAELLYMSEQQSYQRIPIHSSLLTNVTLSSRPLWGGFQFSATCYNCFNQAWATPTGPDLTQPAVPQDGRAFRFKVTYRFSLSGERGGE